MAYELYLNKAVILKRQKDEEVLTRNVEGAAAWGMRSKLRKPQGQGPAAGSWARLSKQSRPCGRSSQSNEEEVREEAGGPTGPGLKVCGRVSSAHRGIAGRGSHLVQVMAWGSSWYPPSSAWGKPGAKQG